MKLSDELLTVGISDSRRSGSGGPFIPSDKLDDAPEATLAFAEQIISRSTSPQWYLQQTLERRAFNTAESLARDHMQSVLAEYLNWSFWGKRTDSTPASEWLAALWDFRHEFTVVFTDRLVIQLLSSFATSTAPESIGSLQFPSGEPIPIPNPLIDEDIYSHLFNANRIVDNEDAKLPKMKEVLARHGIQVHD